MDIRYSLIIIIVRRGFADVVMDAARTAGARGGTILNARGTGTSDTGTFLGVAIEPEKEMVLILTERDIRSAILKAVNKEAGLSTEGHGIGFALPVEEVVGLTNLVKPFEN